ncbi:transposase [Dactylosporangium roseum]|uniref:transposase n=1 Tax=Dactylosporangium roseum TaxID=47989 RepID=UPI0021B4C33E|nr:transposase [Dactylosporangium roseum]
MDTHTDTHAVALLDHLGGVHAEIQVGTDPAGRDRLLGWVAGLVPAGQVLHWSVEGTRTHGLGLVRQLRSAGQRVYEAPKPVSSRRRRGGKSDPLDAVHAARAHLAQLGGSGGSGGSRGRADGGSVGSVGSGGTRLAVPRADGVREALRLLLVTRRHYTDTRTATINVIKSMILTADDELREQLRGCATAVQIRILRTTATSTATSTGVGSGVGSGAGIEAAVRREHLSHLAVMVTNLNRLVAANLRQLRDLVTDICPALLDLPGVGPVSAATLLTAWSHHGRVPTEAAFAALAGAAPVPASSGRHQRHRLNRGGDRTLNAALHTIITARRRIGHAPTRDYLTRRSNEGRNTNEILRCLKRYLARHLYRIMNATATTT